MKTTALFLGVLGVANAFAPAPLAGSRSSQVIMAAQKNGNVPSVAGFVGAAIAASVLSFNAPALADQSDFLPMGSSTIQVADQAKTFDLSLPSYGDISNPTATSETAASLSIDGQKEGIKAPKNIMSEEAREAKKAEMLLSPRQKRELAEAVAAAKAAK